MSQANKDSELILGLVTTVGTDTDEIVNCIKDYLLKFNYQTEIINVSKDVLSQFSNSTSPQNEYERIKYFMDLGDKIRKKADDSSILMQGVVSAIFTRRTDTDNPNPKGRVAYIIKSIKHPDEVNFLRGAYGVGFHLIGITSSYERRLNYLTHWKSLTEEQAKELLARDENEEEGHGQHTRDAFQQSDYFITLENQRDKTQFSIARLIDLLFGNPFISPTFNEYAMFMAYATSLRSADLSRQIGVVITKENEIIAEGANDCPKAFGGLYWPELQDDGSIKDIPNGRDYILGYDSNKREQQEIINNIISNLKLENNDDNIKSIKKAGISSLTEYGRVVHAEMEALMMCARNNISCKNGTMYAITFPCHNCAKHIIASGIKEVIYIEPYPKSKALKFYTNEITQNSAEKDKKVLFTPFVGVGPHRFVELFSMTSTRNYAKIRKDKNGNVINWEESKANLRCPMPLLNYLDYEKGAYAYFCKSINMLKEKI